jgi:hypothetical protein
VFLGHRTILRRKLFGDNCPIVKLTNIIFMVDKKLSIHILLIFASVISPDSYAKQGVLSNPPYFPGNAPAQQHGIPTHPQNILPSIKIAVKIARSCTGMIYNLANLAMVNC